MKVVDGEFPPCPNGQLLVLKAQVSHAVSARNEVNLLFGGVLCFFKTRSPHLQKFVRILSGGGSQEIKLDLEGVEIND